MPKLEPFSQPTPPWTERDLDIVRTLTRKVRVLTVSQIAGQWWEPGKWAEKQARRRLRVLEEAELLERHTIEIHPVLSLEGPVTEWKWNEGVPDPLPDYRRVASSLQRRWSKPTTFQTAYTATPLSANLFASYHAELKLHELTHDVHTGEVYLRYLRDRPEEAKCWVSENVLGKAGFRVKDPDALLFREGEERAFRAVEFGGSYNRKRVEAFHRHCVRYRLDYELW